MNVMDMFSLKGKTAFVTGAGGQLGTQICTALAEAKCNVILSDVDKQLCKQNAKALEKLGVKTYCVSLNVTDIESVKKAAKEANDFAPVDILINNAGISVFTPFENRTEQEFQKVVDVNLTGPFLCSQVFSEYMIKHKSGNIVNIASIYGVVSADKRIYGKSGRNSPEVYAATKGGLIAMTKYLATYLAPNIRVNSISPGGVYNRQDPEFVKNYSYKTPLGRMGNDNDLKGAIVYLSSGASAYVTGHNLLVDGGFTIW